MATNMRPSGLVGAKARTSPWYKLTVPMLLCGKGSGWDGDHARGPTVVPFFRAFDGSRRCVA